MKNNKDYNWDWIEGHYQDVMKALPNNGSVPEKRNLLFVDSLEKTTERKDFILEHSDGKVNYSLNTNGFRGDNFTKVHNKKHIIFLHL
jgi:hypothetical protein